MKREKVYETKQRSKSIAMMIVMIMVGIQITIIRLFNNNDVETIVYCWLVLLLGLVSSVIIQNLVWRKQLEAMTILKNNRRTNQIIMILHKIRDGEFIEAAKDYDRIMAGNKSLFLPFNQYEIGVIKGYYKISVGDWQGLEDGLERRV